MKLSILYCLTLTEHLGVRELSWTNACVLMVSTPLTGTFLECTQFGLPSVDLHAAPVVPHLHTPSVSQ